VSIILLRPLLTSLAAVLIAACGSPWATAQATQSVGQGIVHESWTFKDGAPEVSTALAQTADGYLWVGSPAGLFRFDGVRFELFRSPFGDSLHSTNVSALLAAGDGLWVGYVFGGFSFLKNGKVKNFLEATSSVSGFAADRHGNTWAGAAGGTTRSSLWRFDGSSWQRVGTEWNVPNEPVAQIGFDREGILWVLTGVQGPEVPKQLHFLAPGDRQFRKAADKLFVLGFTRDADGNVLTTRERSRNEPGTSIGLASSLPAYPILRMQSEQFLDRANAIWIIPKDPVVLRHPASEPLDEVIGTVSPGNSEVIPVNPMNHASLVDREGAIWFGTAGAVHRFSHSVLTRQQVPAGSSPWFMLAPDDGGVVWISSGDGVGTSTLYRVTEGKVDLQRPVAGVSSFAYRAPDKTFWFGGEGGLWHMVDGRLARVDLPKEVADRARTLVTMTHDGSGGFWVSFSGLGLYRLKDGAWTKYQGRPDTPPPGTRCPATAVMAMFTDRASRVWLGCTKGQLTVLDADQERTFGPKDGLQVGNVTAIHGRGSAMWIGGEFGLQQFDQGRFHAIKAIGSESLRGISGIVETANGDLWLNGLGGIVHIRREEILVSLKDPAYQVSVERFDRRAGLPGLPSQLRHMPTAIEGTDGRLWFTVSNGVVWLDPTRASNRTPSPSVSIQSVAADDKVHELDQLPSFPAGTSNVEIRYVAVSLLNPEAIRFRYKLQEVDKEWHEAVRSRSVSYRNLPPGSYHFKVNASDANGVWSDKIATAEFTILPAYYQTAWFRALCAILLLLLAWAGHQLRIRRLQRQFEMTLDARVAERTRIARDLHDTLLQSFHGLLLRFQTAFNLLPGRPDESKQVLASAIDQAAEAITEGRDAVQGLRTSATETNDLADSLQALAEDLAKENGDDVSLHVEVQGTPRALHPIVRDEAFRIAGEALRNAFRHASATQIEVELRYDKRHLRVRVRDDGKGMDPKVLRTEGREGHFGLRGMRERAKLAGGKLTVWSGLDAGTEVELSIPAPHAYSNSSSARSSLTRKTSGQDETSVS
jgi:signal transduction histidine kinase/ligand-binding sensor domain-containing protein